jgi:hypothetical protein
MIDIKINPAFEKNPQKFVSRRPEYRLPELSVLTMHYPICVMHLKTAAISPAILAKSGGLAVVIRTTFLPS